MERLSLNRWATPWLRHQHVERYRWASRRVAGRTVLDAACGTGYGTAILAAAGALRVDGLDRSATAVAEARRVTARNVTLLVGDVTALPFRDGGYEAYVSFETIEHVEDDRAYLAEAARVLRPGGLFFCSTPDRLLVSPGHELSDRPSNPFHVREYAPEELAALLRSFFDGVELWGQTAFGAGYRAWLGRIGRRRPGLALRLHQARRILTLAAAGPRPHRPRPLPLARGCPEVLIAIGRRP